MALYYRQVYRSLSRKLQSRGTLFERLWTCAVTDYPMEISYSAVIAEAAGRDPQRVARIEDAKGIDGVMTVLDRR